MKNRGNEDEDNEVEAIPETTGRFGTGFITTFLISRKVKLSGVFYDKDDNNYRKFSVTLDRTPDSKTGMIK